MHRLFPAPCIMAEFKDSISYRNSEQSRVHEGKDTDESCVEKRALIIAGDTYIHSPVWWGRHTAWHAALIWHAKGTVLVLAEGRQCTKSSVGDLRGLCTGELREHKTDVKMSWYWNSNILKMCFHKVWKKTWICFLQISRTLWHVTFLRLWTWIY